MIWLTVFLAFVLVLLASMVLRDRKRPTAREIRAAEAATRSSRSERSEMRAHAHHDTVMGAITTTQQRPVPRTGKQRAARERAR